MVKAAIRTLAEVEHRALTPAPYWKLPGANKVVPRLVEFNTDMDLLNSVLYPPAGGEGGRPRQRHAAHPCRSHGPGRSPASWPVAPAPSKPPASPPKAATDREDLRPAPLAGTG